MHYLNNWIEVLLFSTVWQCLLSRRTDMPGSEQGEVHEHELPSRIFCVCVSASAALNLHDSLLSSWRYVLPWQVLRYEDTNLLRQ
jgi:hypothetical protein